MTSILLAFGIDAWWDGRREARSRADLVDALVSDFEATRERLAESIELGEGYVARADALLMLAEDPAPVSLDSLRFLAGGLFQKIDFEPALSTYEAAVGSGAIRLLQSGAFLRATAEFRRARDFYEVHDGITAQLFFLGPTLELRRELGALGPLLRDPQDCAWMGCYPTRFELSVDEFRALIRRTDVYGSFENIQNANRNIVRGLREMDEAAIRVLETLAALE